MPNPTGINQYSKGGDGPREHDPNRGNVAAHSPSSDARVMEAKKASSEAARTDDRAVHAAAGHANRVASAARESEGDHKEAVKFANVAKKHEFIAKHGDGPRDG